MNRFLINKYFAPQIPSSDDFELPPLEEEAEEIADGDMEITLPDFDAEEESVVAGEGDTSSEPDTVTVEDTEQPSSDTEEEKSLDPIDELSGDGIDLAEIFKDLEDAAEKQEEVIDKIDNGEELSSQDIKTLKQTNDFLIRKIEQMQNEKMELLYRNAELETFGNEGSTPELIVLSKHIKQMETNPKSKEKVLSTIKKMYEDISGDDIEQDKVDKKVDILSAAEQYNSHSNPELKDDKEEEFDLVMD